jgi:3'-phosphoadenosine 5'-phosphosulfate sulfotransferase (PAPS reductase)/FAD synthetase
VDKPVLVGKLVDRPDGSALLVGSPDAVRRVAAQDVALVRRFDGHADVRALAAATALSPEEVVRVAERYAGPRFVVDLADWNKLRWDPVARTYLNIARTDAARWASLPPDVRARLQAVPLSPPCDPWMCLETERRWICEGLTARTGRTVSDQALVLCNNGVRGGVFFWEVVMDGHIVARITFAGEREDEWTWDVLPSFATIALDAHAASSWESKRDQLIEANRELHARLVEDTVAFIDLICIDEPARASVDDETGRPLPLLYFSGGKESVVTLDLFRQAGRPAQLLFAATGLDFTEDNSFIQDLQRWIEGDAGLSRLFRLHIEQADADATVDLLNRKGELGPRDMWCRSQVKYPIRSRAVQALYPDGVAIAFEGSRWYETDYRRGHPRVNEIRDIPGYAGGRQRWAHALADWNGLDIWIHMFDNDLPVNPLYLRGFQRTTCWMCPLIVPFHTQQSRRQNPALWARIEKVQLKGLSEVASQGGRAVPL